MQWNEVCQTTFVKIKELFCSAQVLTFANFSMPFTLHTDASGIGPGSSILTRLGGKGTGHQLHELILTQGGQSVCHT